MENETTRVERLLYPHEFAQEGDTPEIAEIRRALRDQRRVFEESRDRASGVLRIAEESARQANEECSELAQRYELVLRAARGAIEVLTGFGQALQEDQVASALWQAANSTVFQFRILQNENATMRNVLVPTVTPVVVPAPDKT